MTAGLLAGDDIVSKSGPSLPAATTASTPAFVAAISARSSGAVTVNIVAFDDHIAEIDGHTEPNTRCLRLIDVVSGQRALNGERAFYRRDRAWKFREHAITHVASHKSPVSLDTCLRGVLKATRYIAQIFRIQLLR